MIRRQGDDVLQVWELPATAIWFSEVHTVDALGRKHAVACTEVHLEALLHNHTVRTIDGKPVPGVPAPSTTDVQFFKAHAERLGLREMWVTNGVYTGVVSAENLHRFRARE